MVLYSCSVQKNHAGCRPPRDFGGRGRSPRHRNTHGNRGTDPLAGNAFEPHLDGSNASPAGNLRCAALYAAGQGLCRSHPKGIGAAGSCPGGNAPPAGRQPPVCTRFHGCICRKLAHPDGDTEYRLSGTGHPRASLVGDGVLRSGTGAHRYEQGGTDHGLLWARTLPAAGAAAQSPR